MPLTPLPTPPSRQNPASFSALMDAFLAALPLFQAELNTVAMGESAAGLALNLGNSSDLVLGDALLAVKRNAVGALYTHQHEVNERAAFHLFDFIDPTLRSAVAVAIAVGSPTYAVQATAAINLGISAAASARCWLRLPPGTIFVTPGTPLLDETGGMNTCCFPMTSHMYIEGDGNTALKLTAGVSTDAAPKLHSMFFSNQVLSHIRLRHLTLDMNGQANPMSPGRPTTYNYFTQAHFLFSGTPGGVAAAGSDVKISHVHCINTAGVTCIGAAQSNSNGITLGEGWTIEHCRFWNNGLDTVDHSSIYLWCKSAKVLHCEFGADTMWGTVGKTGGLVAIEVHGPDQKVIGCTISNYYQGLWIATNRSVDTEDVHIAHNTIGPVKGIGIDFYREASAETAIHDVTISTNTFRLTDDSTVIPYKVCVQIAASYAVSDVLVCDNVARKSGAAVGSAFGAVGPQLVAGQKHTGITFRGNKARGFTTGVSLSTNAVNGLGRVVVEGNEFTDLAGAGVFSTAIGISGANINTTNGIDFLRIAGNTVSGTSVQYGTYLTGAVGTLDLDHNAYSVTVAGHYEISCAVTRREGFHNSVSFAPAWKSSGAAITPGSSQAAYNLDGDMVTVNAQCTVGATAVPNGTLQLTLPLVSSPTNIQYMGAWRIFDVSAGTWRTGVAEIDGTASIATLNVDGGTNASNTSPVSLATGDVVSVQIDYRRA